MIKIAKEKPVFKPYFVTPVGFICGKDFISGNKYLVQDEISKGAAILFIKIDGMWFWAFHFKRLNDD